MVSRILHFELNGRKVLGFDTGLGSQAFAQSKMAQFITQTGFLVFPDGNVESWRAEGVTERTDPKTGKHVMVVWGPDFPGDFFDNLLRDPAHREESLDAVRYYLKARMALDKDETLFPGASGVMISLDERRDFPRGSVLFPPERLIKRCIEAGGDDEVIHAQQWVHPDLREDNLTVFCAAAMSYTVLTGGIPYTHMDGDTLRQDIREGVFMPLRLAAPGLDKKLDETISEALAPEKYKPGDKKRPAQEQIPAQQQKRPAPQQLLDALGSRNFASCFTPLDDAEKLKIQSELEQHKKNKEFTVKTRRFVIRNTTIITVCAAAVIAMALMVNGYIKRLAEMPNTRGMTPLEVVETYYGSFETLDHEMMEACISGTKAKVDIDMIINLYVIIRTRQAYETGAIVSMTARQWLDRGSPQTDASVFGVTDLRLRSLGGDESRGEVLLDANYKLWMPASFAGDDSDLPTDEELMSENFMMPPPRSYSFSDELVLSWVKDSWRITEINRTVLR